MLGIVVAIVLVAALVALFAWTRHGREDVEIPTADLTPEQKQDQVVRGAAAGPMLGGPGC